MSLESILREIADIQSPPRRAAYIRRRRGEEWLDPSEWARRDFDRRLDGPSSPWRAFDAWFDGPPVPPWP